MEMMRILDWVFGLDWTGLGGCGFLLGMGILGEREGGFIW